jgi:hypothetical protein
MDHDRGFPLMPSSITVEMSARVRSALGSAAR